MSRATTMNNDLRESHYLADGRLELSPAQRRRLRHKRNDLARPTARIGRLRRRYDVKDRYQVRKQAFQVVAMVRNQIAYGIYGSKPDSKRSITRARTAAANKKVGPPENNDENRGSHDFHSRKGA